MAMTDDGIDQRRNRTLLRLVSVELAREGGSCWATYIKDCVGSKTVDKLLQGTPFLRFLEAYPSVFAVERHKKSPHVVRLLSTEHLQYSDSMGEGVEKEEEDLQARIEQTKKSTREYLVFAIRRQQAKRARRQRRDEDISPTANTVPDVPASVKGVQLRWLVKDCSSVIHCWTRLYRSVPWMYQKDNDQDNTSDSGVDTPGNVPLVVPEHPSPGSFEWMEETLPIVEQSLRSEWASTFQIRQDEQTERLRVYLSEDVAETGNINDGIGDDMDQLKKLAVMIESKIMAGGINWGQLVQHEPDIRRLVGGRDLKRLVGRYPDVFRCHLSLEQDDQGQLYIVLSKESREKTKDTAWEGGKMDTDEVGLFSVTNSTIASAIAGRLKRAAESLLVSNKTTTLGSSVLAIDVTAGVGGLTAGLAKHFDSVVGIEMDPTRAGFCRNNMAKLGLHNVTVLNDDCMNVLPSLLSSSSASSSSPQSMPSSLPLSLLSDLNHAGAIAVMVDPPWGGLYYRLQSHREMRLGEWSISQVVEKLYDLATKEGRIAPEDAPATETTPTTDTTQAVDSVGTKNNNVNGHDLSQRMLVGLRMPKTFAVDDFVAECPAPLRVVSAKRLRRQLLVIFRFGKDDADLGNNCCRKDIDADDDNHDDNDDDDDNDHNAFGAKKNDK